MWDKPKCISNTLSTNGLNTTTERQRLTGWIRTRDPNSTAFTRNSYPNRIKAGSQQKTYHVSTHQMRAGVPVLIPDKVAFRQKNTAQDREEHTHWWEGPSPRSHNSNGPHSQQQGSHTWSKAWRTGGTDQLTTTGLILLAHSSRARREKICKDPEEKENAINQQDLGDTCNMLPGTYGISIQNDHILGQSTSLSTFQRPEKSNQKSVTKKQQETF